MSNSSFSLKALLLLVLFTSCLKSSSMLGCERLDLSGLKNSCASLIEAGKSAIKAGKGAVENIDFKKCLQGLKSKIYGFAQEHPDIFGCAVVITGAYCMHKCIKWLCKGVKVAPVKREDELEKWRKQYEWSLKQMQKYRDELDKKPVSA